MKGDKFLIGIVAGVVLLVGAAFAVALLRSKPAYRPDGTPEAAAHNYLLALRQEDYARAYSYLSPDLDGYPDSTAQFEQDVRDHSYEFGQDDSVTLDVGQARITGNEAVVTVQQTSFASGGLFDSSQYSFSFDIQLRQVDGEWKIIRADRYWANCWHRSQLIC